uniref:Uncharacterized protein n=1 Tax=Glossina brevipalpis TaxID=37001 RepID=A0A1A9WZG4_9MUSC
MLYLHFNTILNCFNRLSSLYIQELLIITTISVISYNKILYYQRKSDIKYVLSLEQYSNLPMMPPGHMFAFKVLSTKSIQTKTLLTKFTIEYGYENVALAAFEKHYFFPLSSLVQTVMYHLEV